MRTAPDRCPGVLRVHDAVDGGLVRVRVPGGYLSAAQVAALAAASAAFGDGSVDLTSRGNVQLRGLRPGTADALGSALQVAGLLPSVSHDTARNIVASPLTDLRAVVAEIDRGILSLDPLPGRFLVAVDDGSGDVLSLRPDLALQDGCVVVDGVIAGPGGVPELLEWAARFLAARGSAWRVREVPGFAPSGPSARVGAPPLLGAHGSRVLALTPFGRLTPSQLAVLGDVVVTPWRSVVVSAGTDVSELITDPLSPWVGVTACAGTACASSLRDVRADAVAALAPGPRPLHWSGCVRQCGLPAGAVSRVATAEGYA